MKKTSKILNFVQNKDSIYIFNIIGVFVIIFSLLYVSVSFTCSFLEKVNDINNKQLNNVFEQVNTSISSVKNIENKEYLLKNKETDSVDIYNAKGELYAEILPQNFVSNKEFTLQDNEVISLLFIEDRNFLYRDLTLSLKGFIRSLKELSRGNKQGGSGITQQFVKNIIINDNSSSIERKYKELITSYFIEGKISKVEIINQYLNKISYGKNIFGIQKAGEVYLGKTDLTIEDSFLLNSLLKQPTYYYKNQDKLKERVIYYFGEYKKTFGVDIENDNEYKKSIDYINNIELLYSPKNQRIGPNNYIIDRFLTKIHNGEITEDIKLNYDISISEENIISEKIEAIEGRICKTLDVCDVGIVVMSNSGSIKYLYGGNYNNSQVSSFSSKIEVGSTLKPFIYLNYFDLYGKKNSVPNNKICIDAYCPSNWNGSHSKTTSFSNAINYSYNLPIMNIVKNEIGINNIAKTFQNLGLYSEEEMENKFYSMLLGTKPTSLLNLTNAYTSLFEGKYKRVPLVVGSEDVEAVSIFEKENVDFLRKTTLKNSLNNKRSLKTGTTQDFKDEYIMAINDNFVIGLWLGNKDGTKTKHGIYSIPKGREIMNVLFAHFE